MKISGSNNIKECDLVIFVLTYNRTNVLKECIENLHKNNEVFNLIIIDNGTDNQESIEYLNYLSKKYTIYSYEKKENFYSSLIDNINTSITEYYSKYYSKYYAVTDCDISFVNTKNDFIKAYKYLIDNLDVNVGPELNIHDIPKEYPLKMLVILDNIEVFHPLYKETYLKKIKYNNDYINYHHRVIDTTFTMCLYEKNKIFKPFNNTVRVYYPYSAKHLDWYINFSDITSDQRIYMNTSNGSWGSGWIRGFLHSIENNKLLEYLEEVEIKNKDFVLRNDRDWALYFWIYYYGFVINKDRNKAINMFLKQLYYRFNYYKVLPQYSKEIILLFKKSIDNVDNICLL